MKKTIVCAAALLLSNCASIPGLGMDGDRNGDGDVTKAEVISAQGKYQAGSYARRNEEEGLIHMKNMADGIRGLAGVFGGGGRYR